MRKLITSFLLCSIMCFSIFGLCGCGEEVKIHSILTTSSNASKGDVSGSGNYKTGYEVILSATPKTNSNFVAWVKDDVLVSYESTYKFIAGDDTEGKYTALFSSNKVDYFMVNKINYALTDLASSDASLRVSKIENVSVAVSNSPTLFTEISKSEAKEFNENDVNLIIDAFTSQKKVFFINKTYYFKVSMEAEYIDRNTSAVSKGPVTQEFSVDFSKIISSEVVEVEGVKTYTNENYTLTESSDGTITTITLKKNTMSKPTLFEDKTIIDLSIDFIYPFINPDEAEGETPAETAVVNP